jgi:copper chaperone NosL
MIVNRGSVQEKVEAADYFTHKLIPAEKACWVIGGSKPGIMTQKAKWAFSEKKEALRFIKENGGQSADYKEILKVVFANMYEDIKFAGATKNGDLGGLSDIKNIPRCKTCGMSREKFSHSRTLVEYDNGTVFGFCSLNCLAVDLALNVGRNTKSLQVGNYFTKKLLEADKAYWVLGGNKRAIMSIRAKWAFESKEEVERFIRESGGRPADFEKAMQATYEDLHEMAR